MQSLWKIVVIGLMTFGGTQRLESVPSENGAGDRGAEWGLLETAFKSFFNHPLVKAGQCRENVQNFVAWEMFPKSAFKQGYFVELRSFLYDIYIFDSRWANKKVFTKNGQVDAKWSDGTPFSLESAEYHYFLVLDGMVFDFSRNQSKPVPLQYYINHSLLPPKDVHSPDILFKGKLTRDSVLKNLKTKKLTIWTLDNTNKNEFLYKGDPIHFFNFAGATVEGDGEKLKILLPFRSCQESLTL